MSQPTTPDALVKYAFPAGPQRDAVLAVLAEVRMNAGKVHVGPKPKKESAKEEPKEVVDGKVWKAS